jgi:hypothetical protein
VRITTYPVYRGQLTTVNKAVYTFELYHGGFPAFSTAQNVFLFLFFLIFFGGDPAAPNKNFFNVVVIFSVGQVLSFTG